MVLMEVEPCRVGVDLEAPLPPNEAAEHSNYQSPESILAPTEIGGPLDSLRGSRRGA